MRAFALSALIAAALCGTASAQATSEGFYIGLGGGGSSYAQGVAGQIRSAYAGRTDYSVDTASLTDHSDTAWKATLGFRFLPWLSAEVAWADAGEAASAYRLLPKPLLNTGAVNLHGRYTLDGASLALVGEWPLGDAFAVSLRGGLVSSRLDYREHGTDAANNPYDFDDSDHDNGGLVGLGFAWRLDPQWDLRLDWERWLGVGQRFSASPDFGGGTAHFGKFDHVDMYTLNLFYRFGD